MMSEVPAGTPYRRRACLGSHSVMAEKTQQADHMAASVAVTCFHGTPEVRVDTEMSIISEASPTLSFPPV